MFAQFKNTKPQKLITAKRICLLFDSFQNNSSERFLEKKEKFQPQSRFVCFLAPESNNLLFFLTFLIFQEQKKKTKTHVVKIVRCLKNIFCNNTKIVKKVFFFKAKSLVFYTLFK